MVEPHPCLDALPQLRVLEPGRRLRQALPLARIPHKGAPSPSLPGCLPCQVRSSLAGALAAAAEDQGGLAAAEL